ncbi:lysophospholipid acyltransferase family protein [Gracilimonas sp. BCB1]|uniref:lysophospholipid acyltransferase family protein n=1 Tax=Gracilimonas sp. BCB1 TaxID=3152362 RepID=UPI0032D8C82D
MNFLRAIIKLSGFLVSTLFFYFLIMLCLFASVVGVNYEKSRGYLLRSWGKVCCWIIGIKIEGKNKPPEPPFLLVSNHLSYIDIFVLFSQLRCLFVAKSDVKTWPLIGFIIRTCGILFIDRHRKRDITRVNKLISKNINTNQGIIIFPEGTTSPGYEILPFRSSLLKYPASREFPVSTVAVSYRTNREEAPAYDTICWWDDTPFFVHFFNLLKLKSFTAVVNFGSDQVMASDRKLLAERLKSDIEEQFVPVISENEFLKQNREFTPIAFS